MYYSRLTPSFGGAVAPASPSPPPPASPTESICKKILGMGVIFRDESNDDNYSIISYSDVTVTIL